jgi:hypothetical protein
LCKIVCRDSLISSIVIFMMFDMGMLNTLNSVSVNATHGRLHTMNRVNSQRREEEGDEHMGGGEECPICTLPYDRDRHTPLTICSRKHCLCRDCFDHIQSRPECPFCRERIDIHGVTVNNLIYASLPYSAAPRPNVRVLADS